MTSHWLPATRDTTPLIAVVMVGGVQRTVQAHVPNTVMNPELLERDGFQQKLARFQMN
ncbi:MAG: hypothetical protein IT331_21100 [Anaerolineae bacterium]|nr:hypothetical protein [Anaerolineae bacterium]